MKFDVIVGNPPYNSGEVTIYHRFVEKAIKLNPDYLTMIIPSRWFATGKGLDSFRNKIRHETKISKIVDYPSSKDVFQTVDIAGGVCYFVWEKDYSGRCLFSTEYNKEKIEYVITLFEYPYIIRYPIQRSVVKKVLAKSSRFVSDMVANKTFDLSTDFMPTGNGNVWLYANKTQGHIDISELACIHESFKRYKVIISKAYDNFRGETQNLVCNRTIVAHPNSAFTNTYRCLYVSDSKELVENFAVYSRTKFFKFISIRRKTPSLYGGDIRRILMSTIKPINQDKNKKTLDKLTKMQYNH